MHTFQYAETGCAVGVEEARVLATPLGMQDVSKCSTHVSLSLRPLAHQGVGGGSLKAFRNEMEGPTHAVAAARGAGALIHPAFMSNG